MRKTMLLLPLMCMAATAAFGQILYQYQCFAHFDAVVPLEGQIIEIASCFHNACIVQRDPNRMLIISEGYDSFCGELELPVEPHGVSIRFSIAAVALGDEGVWLVDTGDRFDPVFVNHLDVGGFARDVLIHDHYLFIAVGETIHVYDIEDPEAPILISSNTIGIEVVSMELKDGLLVAVGGSDGIGLVDCTNLSSLDLYSLLDTNGCIYDVVINGDLLYLAGGEDGLLVVDASDSHAPVILDAMFENVSRVSGGGSWVYLLSDRNLIIADLADLENPIVHFRDESLYYQLFDELEYTGGGGWLGGRTLQRLDSVNEESPEPVAVVPMPGMAGGFAVDNGYAVVSYFDEFGEGGVMVLDVSEYETTVVLSSVALDLGGSCADVAIKGQTAYLAENDYSGLMSEYRIRIVDFSNPAAPIEILPPLSMPHEILDLETDGNHLFVANYYAGAAMFDLSDPHAPSEIMRIPMEDLPSPVTGVAVMDENLYLAVYHDGIASFDITDPENPEFVSVLPVPGDINGVEVTRLFYDDVLTVCSTAGLFCYQQSPGLPGVLADSINLPGLPVESSIVRSSAYVASRGAGLQIAPLLLGNFYLQGMVDPPYDPGTGVDTAVNHVHADWWRVFITSGTNFMIMPLIDDRTPVVVSTFSADWVGDAVVVEWMADLDGLGDEFALTASDGTREWGVPYAAVASGSYRAEDRNAANASGSDITYTLSHHDPTQGWLPLQSTRVTIDAPAARRLALSAYPNPFNPSTKIEFNLPSAGQATLRVHDARGALVATLHAGELSAGRHSLTWNGRDDSGRELGSGLYFARLSAGGACTTSRLLLLK